MPHGTLHHPAAARKGIACFVDLPAARSRSGPICQRKISAVTINADPVPSDDVMGPAVAHDAPCRQIGHAPISPDLPLRVPSARQIACAPWRRLRRPWQFLHLSSPAWALPPRPIRSPQRRGACFPFQHRSDASVPLPGRTAELAAGVTCSPRDGWQSQTCRGLPAARRAVGCGGPPTRYAARGPARSPVVVVPDAPLPQPVLVESDLLRWRPQLSSNWPGLVRHHQPLPLRHPRYFQ